MSKSIQDNCAVDVKSGVSETENISEDIISNLPESIVGLILSFLPAKYAVRACVLSKDWEYKWTNMHIIDIDAGELFSQSTTVKESFVKFVDKILLHNPVKKFRMICWRKYHEDHMATWISVLSRKDIESIDISCHYTDIDTDIHGCLVDCTSLKNLKLEMRCTLRVPVRNWFSHLTDLYLVRVRIVNELFPNTTQLTFTFPVLESLELHHCDWLNVELVEINAPALYRFTVNLDKLEASSYQIKIYGPTLSKFEMSGNYLEDIVLSESSVSYAVIGHQVTFNFLSKATATHNGLEARMLLKGFSGLKYLSISADVLEALSLTKGELLPRFYELKQLEAFPEILFVAPALETLILYMRWFNRRQFELESVPPCVVSHLKEIKFIHF